MNRQQLFELAADRFGVDPDYPWNDENAVLRHSGNGKWFAAVLRVRADRLGLSCGGEVDVVNVKCDPAMIGNMLGKPGYRAAYHMNKDKWLTALLDGSAPDDEIEGLLTISYELTAPKIRPAKHAKKAAGKA